VSAAVYVRPEARDDIEQASTWYERQRPGLGDNFLEQVLDALDRIAENPETYPIVHRQTRRAVLRRFPFGVFYRVEDDAIVVIAIIHSNQDPRAWQRRS
jgi:plasmid stabilization system protein ParE